MGAIRFLVFALIIWLVWRLVSNRLAQKGEKNGKTRLQDYGRMVRCSYCNTHLPASQAVRAGDSWFCSDDHRIKAEEKDN